MLGSYGAGILGEAKRLDYADWFSLWLNRDRLACQRAAEVAHGIAIALGGKPDKHVLDALADEPAQAAAMEFEARAAAADDAFMARYGIK